MARKLHSQVHALSIPSKVHHSHISSSTERSSQKVVQSVFSRKSYANVPERESQNVVPERPRKLVPERKLLPEESTGAACLPREAAARPRVPPLLRKDVSRCVLCCSSAAVDDKCMRGRKLREPHNFVSYANGK